MTANILYGNIEILDGTPVGELVVVLSGEKAALAGAQEAIRQSGFADLLPHERHFMLMPLMHSESQVVHEQAVPLFERYTDGNALDFEIKHKVIIDRFGRYPHRNAVLGRKSTEEEAEFLKQEGSSF